MIKRDNFEMLVNGGPIVYSSSFKDFKFLGVKGKQSDRNPPIGFSQTSRQQQQQQQQFSSISKGLASSLLSSSQGLAGKNRQQQQLNSEPLENKNPYYKPQPLPDLEEQAYRTGRAFVIQPPKHGVLRKAKLAKNIYDLAREDSFDPSPEASSIELFLLRQKQLGPNEVPPPGHYFDEEKFSSFKLQKSSSANIHFNSTEQRILSFGNASHEPEVADNPRSPTEMHLEWKKQQYMTAIHANPSQFSEPQRLLTPLQTQSTMLKSHNILPSSRTSTTFMQNHKSKRHHSSSSQQFQKTSSFGSGKKTCLFSTVSNFPGPGYYYENFEDTYRKRMTAASKPDIYFKSFFGSGSKRFQDIK